MTNGRLYSVTFQRPTTYFTPTNQTVPGIELHVEAGNIAFILTVPADTEPAFIDGAIRQELSKRLEIARLGSEQV